jgi:hypothetical protein
MKEGVGKDFLALAWEYPGQALEVIPARFSKMIDPTFCTGMFVEVNVQTDDYPAETAWTLVNKCGTGITISSPPYAWYSVKQSTSTCLPRGEYEFTITDTYDDGICCNFGQGNYEILVDGIPLHSGGQFGSFENKTFGACTKAEFSARKVRVKLERQNYLHMREVQVFDQINKRLFCPISSIQSSEWKHD